MKKTGITRKQAIKKMGKYAALTAIGTFAILNPKKAQVTAKKFMEDKSLQQEIFGPEMPPSVILEVVSTEP